MAVAVGLVVSFCYAPKVFAQDPVAVLWPLSETVERTRLRPLGRVVRARVVECAEGPVVGSPLGWRDLQLAAGCVGDGDACFRLVAEQLEVSEVVLPVVERDGDSWTVEVIRWRGAGQRRQLVRRDGPRVMPRLLDAMTDAVRALYELPPLATPPEASLTGEDTTLVRAQQPALEPLLGPLILGAGALGVAGVGLAFGLVSQASAEAWQVAPVGTREEVDDAFAVRGRAATEALVADIVFVVAAAGVVAAVAWLVVELTDMGASAPVRATPGGLAVAFDVVGRGGSAP